MSSRQTITETKVHCPGCRAALRVPPDASGQLARCPACRTRFRVPPPHELLEETASVWIEESVEEEERRREQEAAEREARITEGIFLARETKPLAPEDLPEKLRPAQLKRRRAAHDRDATDQAEPDADAIDAPPVPIDGQDETDAPPKLRRVEQGGKSMPAEAADIDESLGAEHLETIDEADDEEIIDLEPLARSSDRRTSSDVDDTGHDAAEGGDGDDDVLVVDDLADNEPREKSPDDTDVLDISGLGLQEASQDEAGDDSTLDLKPIATSAHTKGLRLSGAVGKETEDKKAAAEAPADSPKAPPAKPTPAKVTQPAATPGRITTARDIDRPLLTVLESTTTGVRIAFDAAWIENPRFRASMPVRCVYSGEAERGNLLARPLVFSDRSQAKVRSAEEVEARYEQPMREKETVIELLRRFGLMDDLPSPFNLAMPYFVTVKHRNKTLNLRTKTRSDGGINCEVLIPDAAYALEWIANVNGICGPEYEMLLQDVTMLNADNWRRLPDAVRQRLGAWCSFEPGEHFMAYVADADFGKRERGLAGIVVTDRRLIYHKYHRHGELSFAEPLVIVIEQQGNLANVYHQTDDRRTRCCVLPVAEANIFIETIEAEPNVQLLIAE